MIGPTQRRLLLLARQGAIRVSTAQEKNSALKLHDNGLLARGRTSNDYTITQRGLNHGEEQEAR